MQPEIEALLLVILIVDAVGVGAVAALSPPRHTALRVAIVLLIPVAGTAIQLIGLQLDDADRAGHMADQSTR